MTMTKDQIQELREGLRLSIDSGFKTVSCHVDTMSELLDDATALAAPSVEEKNMALVVEYPDGSEVAYLADNARFLEEFPWNRARWITIKPVPSPPPPASYQPSGRRRLE